MSLPVRIYEAEQNCRGLILFASGDGGWKEFEDKICRYFARKVCVWSVGTAKNSPIAATLASGFAAAVEEAKLLCRTGDVPIIFSGYSTGAEQAVAAATAVPRQPKLIGLLIIAPAERGRYGITMSDLMGIRSTGEASFGLSDLAPKVSGLRIVQIHGEHDPLDSTEWLQHLDTPYQLKTYPDGWHFFKGGPPDFHKVLGDGIDWILGKS